MNVQEFLSNGGKLFHRRRGKRSVTVAYKVDESSGNIYYGATIHKKESRSEQFIYKVNSAHAVERFVTSPVVVPNIETETKFQLEKYIRSCMITNGCFSPHYDG